MNEFLWHTAVVLGRSDLASRCGAAGAEKSPSLGYGKQERVPGAQGREAATLRAETRGIVRGRVTVLSFGSRCFVRCCVCRFAWVFSGCQPLSGWFSAPVCVFRSPLITSPDHLGRARGVNGFGGFFRRGFSLAFAASAEVYARTRRRVPAVRFPRFPAGDHRALFPGDHRNTGGNEEWEWNGTG